MGLYQDTKVTYKTECSGISILCVKCISVTGVIKAEQPIASKRSDRLPWIERTLRRRREEAWRENKRRKMEER